jgi:hypothetical protein
MDHSIFLMIWTSILLFPIFEHFRGPGGAWVTQYCSRCGLRLVAFLSLPRGHYIHAKDASLQALPTGEVVEGAKVRSCPSPLGPPEPVDGATILNYPRRYQHLQSTTTLQVDIDPGNSLPSVVWDATRKQKLHRIEHLNGYDPAAAYHARFLWPDKHTASELLPRRPWAFSDACISVADARSGRCVGASQLAQQSWDTVIYLPHNLAATKGSPRAENSAYRVYNCWVGQDREVFSRQCPQFFVPGTRGSTLLWTVRRIVTADEREGRAKPTARLVLLDGYDRLVAANDGAWTSKQSSGKERKCNVLRIYTPLDDGLVDAVVVSYTVLCAQMLRRIQWDQISSDETSPS